jgi:hypothetical protein
MGVSPNNGRLDDTLERPPPKGNAELFNPKGGRQQPTNGNGAAGGDTAASADALADQIEGLSLIANGGEPLLTASPTPDIAPPEV